MSTFIDGELNAGVGRDIKGAVDFQRQTDSEILASGQRKRNIAFERQTEPSTMGACKRKGCVRLDGQADTDVLTSGERKGRIGFERHTERETLATAKRKRRVGFKRDAETDIHRRRRSDGLALNEGARSICSPKPRH